MTDVYAVTSGAYSDYHIEKIFSNRSEAEIFASLQIGDRHVEAYHLYDSMEDAPSDDRIFYQVEYDPEHNYVVDLYPDYDLGGEDESYLSRDRFGRIRFYTCIQSNERLRMDLFHAGNDSLILKKILTDRYAQYQAEQEGVT